MYAILSGALPFPGQSQQEIYANITHGRIKMRGSRWEKVSREAKDLISKLLVKNPKNRPTAD
jgi:serine/threonine protein kinase